MMDNILKYFIRIVLFVFNPYLIPTLGFVAIMNYIPGVDFFSTRLKFVIVGVVLLSSCIIPLTFILLINLNRTGEKGMTLFFDNVMPNILFALCTFLGSQFLGRLPIPGIFSVYLLGFCILMIISVVISYKWKISEFTMTLGGLLGILIALNFKYGMNILWLIIGIVLISGVVGSSRIYMEKDSQHQVYSGFLTGVLSLFLFIFLL